MGLKHDSFKKRRKERAKWKYDTWEEYEQLEKNRLQEELRYLEPTVKGQVRITGGKVKNFQLDIPRKTRPLTDRMKTRIFDILREDIANKSILDLFAGSGSFGLEALSRGAKEATFIDAARQAEGIINENIRRTGFLVETTVVRSKAEEFVHKAVEGEQLYEIVFLDPPYKQFNTKNMFKINDLLNEVKQLLPGFGGRETKLFKGVIIMKHPRRYPVEKLSLPGLRLFETFLFGLNAVSFWVVSKEVSGQNLA